MPIINAYVSDEVYAILDKTAKAMGRTVSDLAETAISTAAYEALSFDEIEEMRVKK